MKSSVDMQQDFPWKPNTWPYKAYSHVHLITVYHRLQMYVSMVFS